MAEMPSPSSGAPCCSPFFIIGAMRSGTTLLRLMLAAHHRLAIPPESHFLPELLKFEQSSGQLADSREKVIAWLVAHRRLADFGLGADWIRAALAKLEPFTTRSIACTVFNEYARRQGKSRWGDKTPRYRAFVPELSALFPSAKFIHMIRDGRDTALSCLSTPFWPMSWTTACYLWRDSLREAWEGRRAVAPELYLEVRYEELLEDSATTLQRVLSFLGEEFDSRTLHFSELSNQVPVREKVWHAKLQGPLDRKNSGKWKTALSAEQIHLFQSIAGQEMVAAGYPLAEVTIGPSGHARVFVQKLGHEAMLPLRKARERLRQLSAGPLA
jgi:Sulfotransferase family